MSQSADVCSSCSEKLLDPKSTLQCCGCKKYYHGACQGVVDFRGFRTKRSNWKCSECLKESGKTGFVPVPEVKGGAKRFRSESHEIIEVDRLMFEGLISSVNLMSKSMDDLKQQICDMQIENRKLVDMITAVTKVKSVSVPFSYSSAVKSNLAPVVVPNSNKTADTDNVPPFVFSANVVPADRKEKGKRGTNLNPVAISPKITSELVSAAIEKARQNVKELPVLQEAKKKNRKKRISLPSLIGTKDLEKDETSGTDSSVIQGMERFRWVYVGRIKAGTTAIDMEKFVRSNFKTTNVKCFLLTKPDYICSFKVGVSESLFPDLMKPENWPRHVAIREFVNLSDNAKIDNKIVSTPPVRKDFLRPLGIPVDT